MSLSISRLTEEYPQPLSAYIHIPFCRRRCYYCDFPISVLGNQLNTNTSVSISEYVEALCLEIQLTPSQGKPLKTVFFGGGTPSLLPVNYLEKILLTLDKQLSIAPDAEISMEMDPGTFTFSQLEGYKLQGVNRVSLGIQAFQDELLKLCGRSHKLSDIFTAVNLIHQANLDNFSLDLISGLPHQTLEDWQDSLNKAIEIQPKHISCYDLVIESVTAFGKQYKPGEKPLPTDEITAQMYKLAQNLLTNAGYEHYEISNYAQPSYQCQHNRVYWENRPYYGFGMGAASYVNNRRFTRPRTRKQYFAWLKAGAAIDLPETSTTDMLLETLMLGLRMAEGVNLSNIEEKFGQLATDKIWQCLQRYHEQGWVSKKNLQIRLSDPEGFLFSNTVLTALFESYLTCTKMDRQQFQKDLV